MKNEIPLRIVFEEMPIAGSAEWFAIESLRLPVHYIRIFM